MLPPSSGPNEGCGRNTASRSAIVALLEIADRAITNPCLGISGIETHPRHLAAAEAALTGARPSWAAFREAAEIAAAAVAPLEAPQTTRCFDLLARRPDLGGQLDDGMRDRGIVR